MRYFLFSVLLLLVIVGRAQYVEVYGTNIQYANDTLVFYTTDDYITNTKLKLAEIIVNDTGYFYSKFIVKQTCLAYVYLGVYKGLIFFEPEKSYNIKLPEKKEKEIADVLNPYFKETELYLGIYNSNKDDLNFLVKKFDYFYDHYIEDNFYIIYRQGYHAEIDTFITKLSGYFEFARNKYFDDYMLYKFANLRMIANERDLNFVTYKYFLNKKILYNNVAYMDLFNQLYHNYFSYYAKTKEGKDLYNDIVKAKSIFHIKKTLDNNLALANDTLKELVILKGLTDAFYPAGSKSTIIFPKAQLLQTLDSMIILTNIAEHKHIAENLKNKASIKRLSAGDDAPEIKLIDSNEEKFSLKKLKGKYVYLCFYSSWSISCMQEIGLLKNIYKKHNDKLEIVSVFCDGDIDNMKNIIKENDYNWIFVHLGNKKEILKDYNINIYPAYVLIDPYSKIVLLPAPSPNENFEKVFFNVLMSRN